MKSERQFTQHSLWDLAMCWKCDEIDKVIVHYRTMSARVTDQLTLEGLRQLVNKLQAEKSALHPKPEKEDRLD
jgi:hypothetical protein